MSTGDIRLTDKQDNEHRARESRRILDQISRETDGGSLLSRATGGIRSHVTAKDAEAEDPIDRLGTRIGRAVGLVFTIGLVVWLVVFLIRGG